MFAYKRLSTKGYRKYIEELLVVNDLCWTKLLPSKKHRESDSMTLKVISKNGTSNQYWRHSQGQCLSNLIPTQIIVNIYKALTLWDKERIREHQRDKKYKFCSALLKNFALANFEWCFSFSDSALFMVKKSNTHAIQDFRSCCCHLFLAQTHQFVSSKH